METGIDITALRKLSEDSEIHHRVNLGVCARFVQIELENARDMAKCGKKDEARNILRFFRNSRLIEILAHENETQAIKEMRKTLRTLEGECHPDDVPNFTSDLQAIRSHLETVIDLLVEQRANVVLPLRMADERRILL